MKLPSPTKTTMRRGGIISLRRVTTSRASRTRSLVFFRTSTAYLNLNLSLPFRRDYRQIGSYHTKEDPVSKEGVLTATNWCILQAPENHASMSCRKLWSSGRSDIISRRQTPQPMTGTLLELSRRHSALDFCLHSTECNDDYAEPRKGLKSGTACLNCPPFR